MTTFEKINDVLVHLFQEIWELEEKAIITEEFKIKQFKMQTSK